MPRVPKNNINTPFLHIMIQGNNKNHIFNNKIDTDKYLKILKDTKKEIDVTLISYCIMSNHAHLLFYVQNMNYLIKYMHKTNLIYAKYYNYKYDRVGYVFRDRYKVQPIYSEKHLINCIDYIHNNPVKAGICNNKSDYKYSSYNNNMFQNNSDMEIKIREYIKSKKTKYTNENSDFILLEDDETKISNEELVKELLDKYINYYNITMNELKSNKQLLCKIVKKLKCKYNISLRIASKVIGIGRETLRNLMAKYNEKKERYE